MIRVLVTGASGFVGRQAVAALLEAGAEVHGCSRRPPTAATRVRWHSCDLLEPGAPQRLIAVVRPTHVLHCAWTVEHGRFWSDLANLDWLAASAALLRAFAEHGGRRFVGVGTSAEYPVDASENREDGVAAPSTLYGASKNALRQVVAQTAAETGFSHAWARLFLLIGPDEQRARLVPYVVNSLLRGEPALCSRGEQQLDFMDVREAGAALAAVLLSETEGVINVARGKSVAVAEVVRRLSRIIGREDLVRLGARTEAWKGSRHLQVVIDRLTREVGFTPCRTLDETLRDAVAWWRCAMEDGASL